MLTDTEAITEVARFRRCPNYPTDTAGVTQLADGLKRAAKGLEQAQSIVTRCLEISSYCPTDHDMLAVAAELYPPAPEPSWVPSSTRCPAGRCDGHGWAQVFFLVTQEGEGRYAYQRKERISEEQYRLLVRKVDGRKQRAYETVEKCACQAPDDQRQLAAGERPEGK